jgi:hypothetical protein
MSAASAARRAQIQRLRRRLDRHERLCAELQTQAQVEAFYASLMRDRLAGLEAEERARIEATAAGEGVQRGV